MIKQYLDGQQKLLVNSGVVSLSEMIQVEQNGFDEIWNEHVKVHVPLLDSKILELIHAGIASRVTQKCS